MNGLFEMIPAMMALSIPIVAIVTGHLRSNEKIKNERVKSELELERLKHENYVIETQKLRLELEQMKLEDARKDLLLTQSAGETKKDSLPVE